jgi:sugar lactone lactonase YvrE
MIKSRLILPLVALTLLLSAAVPASAWFRSPALPFAVLPDGATGPEGLTVGPDGNVYVATFGFNAGGAVGGPGQLYVFAPNGHLLRQVAVQNSTSHLLGIGFHPATHKLLVIDFGGAQVLSVNPVTGASSPFMTLADPTGAGLNAMTFDKSGNVYVSDSFTGNIYKTGSSGGVGAVWVSDALLTTKGVPPFGANGMVFNHAGDALFVANTGEDRILKVAVNSNGTAGAVSVFTNSINGADGIAIDRHDNLWVAANQEDEIVVVDPTGKAIAKLGDFYGLSAGCSSRPASISAPMATGSTSPIWRSTCGSSIPITSPLTRIGPRK